MISGGQIGFGTMFSLSLVIGGLLGVIALALRHRVPPRHRRSSRSSPTGPLDREAEPLAEPEPVGPSVDGLDTSPITSREEHDDLRTDG
jgi:hypothetical protein